MKVCSRFNVAILVYIVFMCIQICSGQNYIINPSFEDPTLNAWSKNFWSGSGTFTIDSSEVKSGNQSLKINSASGGTATVWQEFSVQPNKSYLYTGWTKTSSYNASGGNTGLEIKTSTGVVQMQNLFSASVANATTWTQFTIQFTIGSNDTVVTAIMDYGLFSSGATGSVWFDDLSLTVLSTNQYNLSFSTYSNGKPAFQLNNNIFNPVLLTLSSGSESDLINYKNAGFNMIYLPVDYNNIIGNSSLQNLLNACRNQQMPVILELVQGSLWSYIQADETRNMRLSPDYSSYTSYPFQYVHYFPDFMNPATRSYHNSRVETAISNLSTFYHNPIVGISIGATDIYHIPDGEYHVAFNTLYPHPKGEARQTWLPYGSYSEASYKLYLTVSSTNLSSLGFSNITEVYAPWDIDTARNLEHWRSWLKYRRWYVLEFVKGTVEGIKKYNDLLVTGTFDLNFAIAERFGMPTPEFQDILDFPIYYLYGNGIRKEGSFSSFFQTARADAWSKGKPGIAMKEFSSDISNPSYSASDFITLALPFVSGYSFQYGSGDIGGTTYVSFTTAIHQINQANTWSNRPNPANLAVYISLEDVNNWDKGYWAALLLYYMNQDVDILYSLDSITQFTYLHIPGGQPKLSLDSVSQNIISNYVMGGGQLRDNLLSFLSTPNLIVDNSFESGTLSNFAQGVWTGTATIGNDTSLKHSGARSLKISGNSASATVWQTVNGISTSKEYAGSLWLYSPESNRGNGNTTLEWKSNGTAYFLVPEFGWNNLGWASGWTQFLYPMNSANATQFGLICAYNIYGSGSGPVWYDDLELMEIDTTSSIDSWELMN